MPGAGGSLVIFHPARTALSCASLLRRNSSCRAAASFLPGPGLGPEAARLAAAGAGLGGGAGSSSSSSSAKARFSVCGQNRLGCVGIQAHRFNKGHNG